MKYPFVLIILIAYVACSPEKKEAAREKYRPVFHFSPEKNWTNDPNGLVYYEGEYHLFFQYNPYGDTWGHMSWGHAVSTDWVSWKQLPVAIEEYQDPITGDSTMIFSGTCVVDKNNSSGLCEGNDYLVAIYTSHVHKNNQGLRQHQSVAYSNDKGRTWKRYDKNPVLDIQRTDFRDPKVFWHGPQQKWVMALVIPDLFKVQFYQSKNLLQWELMSEFGHAGDSLKIWECPDLYELPVQGQPAKTKWVLSLSGSHPAGPGFVGMQYFVGDFDGNRFISGQKNPLYLEYGKDFYAGIVFNNVKKRTVMLGWVNNWTYANVVPTSPWRGAFSLPRELALTETSEGFRLTQKPIEELVNMRSEEVSDIALLNSNAFELSVEIPQGGGIRLFKSGNEETIIGYANGKIYLDRTRSGNVSFQKNFASVESVVVSQAPEKMVLRLFADHSIIEVFSEDGLYAITDQVFPTKKNTPVELFGGAKVLRAWKMKGFTP
jgi:fructan beta-fructosidase